MKQIKVILAFWYNVNNRSMCGYDVFDYNDESKIYFSGTYDECVDYVEENNMICEGE